MENNTKTKYGAGVAVIFMILCIGGVWFIKNKIEGQKNSLSEKYEVVNLLREESDIFVLQQSLQVNKKEIDQLLSYIISENGVVSYVETLEKIANSTGAVLVVEKIEQEDGLGKKRVVDKDGKSSIKDVRTYGKLIIRLKVDGSWQEIMSFISTIERLPKYTDIKDVRISSASDDGKVIWNANVIIEAVTI